MPAKLQRVAQRLLKGNLHQTVGRFRIVRQTYSVWQGYRQRAHPDHYRDRLQPRSQSLFAGIAVERCRDELQREAVSFGFQLPAELIEQIYHFALTAPCREPGFPEEFQYGDVQQGRLPTGRPVQRGLVIAPTACEAVEQVAQDPLLLEITRQYLGYWPTQVTRHLTWTFVTEMPEAERKDLYNPLGYHYDVAGYNFMSSYFYLTPVDADSGAHAMIRRSHRRKPLHTLVAPRSGRQPDERVLSYYGHDKEIVIEGPPVLGLFKIHPAFTSYCRR